MSILDKVRSFSESRAGDAELLPTGALSYGDMRDLLRLLDELGRSRRLEVEARIEALLDRPQGISAAAIETATLDRTKD